MTMVTFGSVCSGIEAASVAWHPLGWKTAWLSEIEPFPCAVLAHHYPSVKNLGDMTRIAKMVMSGTVEAPDVLTGGTPCQAFSIAGLRKGLGDPRGQLSLSFCQLADAIDDKRKIEGKPASIIVWENVQGVLTSKDNAFGCFLSGLAGEDGPLVPPGGKWANAGRVLGPKRTVTWRILDAQYFGVAQRRRRVWVVASARAGFDPAAVLFEFDGVRRDTAPSREARQVAPTIPARSTAGGGLGTDFDCDGGTICVATGQAGADMAPTLNCNHEAPYVGHSLRGEGFDASEDGTGRGTPLVPVAYTTKLHNTTSNQAGKVYKEYTTSLDANSPPPAVFQPQAVMQAMKVRRLTPRECERLQGFPDDYTLIPWRKKPASECPDGPRYRSLGNSWAVPVAKWIGQRIDKALSLDQTGRARDEAIRTRSIRASDEQNRALLGS